MRENWKSETICIQGGYKPKVGEPRVLPIVQSTTYQYESVEQLEDLFDLKTNGHMYSRISNPTVAALEEKLAILEGGVGAVATSSGQAAITLAVLNICKAGDHILCSSTLYGGTVNLLGVTLKKLGIEAIFINPDLSEDEILSYARPNTKAIYGETLGNPGLNVLDFDKFSSVAKKLNVPFIVDNTLASPYLCNPILHGANIVVHSTTKYIDGHAVSVGGVVIDGGNFSWDNGKFEEFVVPDESYHGISYVETFGRAAYIVKARVQLMRDYGNCMSPFNAFLTNLGLETLHVRMERHCSNAFELARWLNNHPNVEWVNYPMLDSSKTYNLCQKYLNNGGGGVLTFGIKGGVEAAKKFMNKLKLASLVVHVGDIRTYVLHPVTTTHRQLSDEQQLASGVTKDMIRVSVGIENIDDIIEDFSQALDE